MRKCTAIFLIFTFAISQYAKQLGYFECRIANAFTSENARCDCEKILEDGKNDAPAAPASKVHNHIHVDEYFLSQPRVAVPDAEDDRGKKSTLISTRICPGVSSTLYQPPDVLTT